jgi:hypothetical protein
MSTAKWQNIAGSKKLFSNNQMLPVLEHTVAHSILALPPHCVFKWILRGHFKPTPNAIIINMFEVISITYW